MPQQLEHKRDVDKAVGVVRDAGGRIVGRTRFQKIAYLLEITGLGDGFRFAYRNFGPYSEELTTAAWQARLLGLLREEEHPASWGGSYSIFQSVDGSKSDATEPRVELIKEASQADAIALELAATAAFLSIEGIEDPWRETQRRKPEKAAIRLAEARSLYGRLKAINTPQALPDIA